MTNETPENPQSTSADLTAGQHDFGATLSSENAAAPAPVAAPEPAVPSEPEPVVPSEPEPTIPPVDAPIAYDAAVAVAAAQDGTHAFPAGGHPASGYPAEGQQSGGYSAEEQQRGGYPVGAYPGAYPAAAPAPKKPMSKGLLFGIIGGAVLLVLLVAAVIVVPVLLRAPAQTASGVVEEYLTAIAEGDAETALTFVDSSPEDSLLNDEVLAASIELAPITDIVVEEPEDSSDDYEAVITASFAVGGETVERDFKVWNYGDEWQIGDGLVSMMLTNFEGLGVMVNGVEPGDDYVYVFPGAYQLSLSSDEFALDSDTDTFTLVTDTDSEGLWDVQPVLTDEAADTFRSLVRAAVEECVAMKTLTTPCGMDITDIDLQGYTAIDDSVTRTITAEGQKDLDAMEPEPDYSTPTLVSTYDSVDVDMTLKGKKGGETAEFDVWFGGYMKSPSVDFAAETPTVTWE